MNWCHLEPALQSFDSSGADNMADDVERHSSTDGVGNSGPDHGQPPGNGKSVNGGLGLTQDDVELLAQAIRAGTATPPPTGTDAVLGLVKIILAIFLLFAAWEAFHSWHPDVSASYSTTTSGTLTSFTLGASGSTVGWNIPGVYAGRVDLRGPANQDARVVLPVRALACPALATHLALTCQNGKLMEPEAISIDWNSPQLLYLNPEAQSRRGAGLQESAVVSLCLSSASSSTCPTVEMPPARLGASVPSQVDLTVTGTGPLDWCYATPTPNAILTLQNGPQRFTVPAADMGVLGCNQGLTLDVEGNAQFASQRPPEMTFGDTSAFTLEATSDELNAQDLNGTLNLGSAGTDSLSPAASVVLDAPRQNPIHAMLVIDKSLDNLELSSSQLASASSDGTQLVSSFWDRNATLLTTVFGALILTVLAFIPSMLGKSSKWWTSRSKRKHKQA